jgi:hypothetical protein
MLVCGILMSLSFVACSSDNDSEVNTSPISIPCGETLDLSSRGSSFNSANSFVASVSGTTLKANHIGTTLVSLGEKSIPVTVTATVDFIEHPCVSWGASMSEVKSAQKSGTEIASATGATNALLYKVENSSGKTKYLYMYTFENEKLKASAVFVPVTEATTLVNWLSERYFMLPISSKTSIAAGGYDAYSKSDATTICAISSETVSNSYYNMSTKYNYLVMFSSAN